MQLVALSNYYVAEFTGMEHQEIAPLIPDLREASRQVVRQLGLLQRTMPTMAHSASQCHLLIEIERLRRATVAELAEVVCLDKSTASRALSALERDGLIEQTDNARDRRSKPLRLTREGRRAVAQIHKRADAQVASALECLVGEERERVLEGMALYAKALGRSRRLAEVCLRSIRRQDEPELAHVITEALKEYGAGQPGFIHNDPDIERMYAVTHEREGEYVVAERDGQILGGAGIVPLAGGRPEDCELQKMYLSPEVRGLGLGGRLLRECLERARRRGFKRCYLETMAHMLEARRLYERHGFERHEKLGDTGHCWCNTFYAREL